MQGYAQQLLDGAPGFRSSRSGRRLQCMSLHAADKARYICEDYKFNHLMQHYTMSQLCSKVGFNYKEGSVISGLDYRHKTQKRKKEKRCLNKSNHIGFYNE